MTTGDGAAPPRVLRGWKEIARHLGTSARTAQRYAEEAGLPVHRPGRRASVSAFADDLTAWMREVGSRDPSPASGAASDVASGRSDGAGPVVTPGLVSRTASRVRPQVAAALVTAFCLALAGAWWALRSPGAALHPPVPAFRVQVGVPGTGAIEMRLADGHPGLLDLGNGAITLVPTRVADGLRLAFYAGEEPGHRQLPMGEATLSSPGTGAPPVLLKLPGGALELSWVGID